MTCRSSWGGMAASACEMRRILIPAEQTNLKGCSHRFHAVGRIGRGSPLGQKKVQCAALAFSSLSAKLYSGTAGCNFCNSSTCCSISRPKISFNWQLKRFGLWKRRSGDVSKPMAAFSGSGNRDSSSGITVKLNLPKWTGPAVTVVKSVAAMVLLERVTMMTLQACDIAFPSSVTLMGLIAGSILITGSSFNQVYRFYAPAVSFFDQWFPLLFVPSVAGVCLAPLPPRVTMIKALFVLSALYLYTLWGSVFVVTDLEKLEAVAPMVERKRPPGAMTDAERIAKIGEGLKLWTKNITGKGAKVLAEAATATRDADVQKMAIVGAQVLDSVSERIVVTNPTGPGGTIQSLPFNFLAAVALLLPAALDTGARSQPFLVAPGMILLTVGIFRCCTRLPPGIRRWASPTVAAGILVAVVAGVYGAYALGSWRAGVSTYMSGAGLAFSLLISPGVASLGFKVYTNRAALSKAFLPLVVSALFLAPTSLVLVAVLGRVLALDPNVAVSIMPSTTTLGLALEMGPLLRASPSLTVAGVTLAGALGVEAGQAILDAWKVRNPIARGIAIGSSSHAVGTSALFRQEPQAAAVAGLSLALKGTASVLLLSTPGLKVFLLKIAGLAT